MLVFGEWWEMLLLLFENSATTYTVYLVVVVFVSTRRIVAVCNCAFEFEILVMYEMLITPPVFSFILCRLSRLRLVSVYLPKYGLQNYPPTYLLSLLLISLIQHKRHDSLL